LETSVIMNIITKILTLTLLATLILFFGCGNDEYDADAYGNFESDEVVISSEVNGKLVAFDVQEGDHLARESHVGLVDTAQLYFQRMQLQASIVAIQNKTMDIQSELNVWKERKKNLQRELHRLESLLKGDVATQKQVDDLQGEIEVVERQIIATETRLKKSNNGILSEIEPLQWQIKRIRDQIKKSQIVNPIDGTILAKYVEQNEIVMLGKPLFKIADLETVFLRAYLTEPQLASISLGKKVEVSIDDGKQNREYEGLITWISDVAEFTPKVIQTREERANLVYAMKVKVLNDGSIKLGMPGEVRIPETRK